MRSTVEIWMLTTGLFVAVAIAVSVNLVVPQFNDVFQNFGAELPLLTRLFVEGRHVFFGLPLLVLAAWALTPSCAAGQRARHRRAGGRDRPGPDSGPAMSGRDVLADLPPGGCRRRLSQEST